MGSAKYTTRRDAEQAVRSNIVNGNSGAPASDRLAEQVADRAWRHQETADEALRALAAEGVDCEGFES